jgi:hypothetical protein
VNHPQFRNFSSKIPCRLCRPGHQIDDGEDNVSGFCFKKSSYIVLAYQIDDEILNKEQIRSKPKIAGPVHGARAIKGLHPHRAYPAEATQGQGSAKPEEAKHAIWREKIYSLERGRQTRPIQQLHRSNCKWGRNHEIIIAV